MKYTDTFLSFYVKESCEPGTTDKLNDLNIPGCYDIMIHVPMGCFFKFKVDSV